MAHERRRVLMVMDSLSVGGTETHVLSLVKALTALGGKPVYAGAGGPMYEAYARAGCPMFKVDLTPGALMNPAAGPRAAEELGRIMRRQRIDAVHVHQMPSGLHAAKAARELGIPVVFTVHGAYYSHEQLQEMRNYCAAFVSVSVPVQRSLKQIGIESELLPNGVDPREFHPAPPPSRLREELGIPPKAPVVVYASRLAWDKAAVCAMLILATARARAERRAGAEDAHLVIVGGGSQYGEIRELADSLRKDGSQPFVHLTGSRTRLRDYYALADLVVGTGRVALEAMSCGKAVLAIGNHGFFGLVEPSVYPRAWEMYFGDHDSERKPSEELIAEQLETALSEPERLREWGARAREWMMAEFDIRRLGVRLMQIYDRVAREAAGAKGRGR